MKTLFTCCCIVGLLAAPWPSTRADGPTDELEGAWFVYAVTMNGVKATDRIAGGLKITVRGNKLMVKPGLSVDGNGKVEVGDAEGNEATFAVDRTKTPGHIDLSFGAGGNKIAVKGIYTIEKGELKICFSPKARPKNFANVVESGETLLIAKRLKP